MAGRGKPGPARTKLVQLELDAILGHIDRGHGRMRACQLAGINYKTFARRLAESPELRDRVVQAERARAEDCVKVVYDLREHDEALVRLSAAKAYLHRDDRQREARRAIRDRLRQQQGSQEQCKAILPQVIEVLSRYCPPDQHEAMLADLERLADEEDATARVVEPGPRSYGVRGA